MEGAQSNGAAQNTEEAATCRRIVQFWIAFAQVMAQDCALKRGGRTNMPCFFLAFPRPVEKVGCLA